MQLAPYNTVYERLAGHMAAAGVAASPNLWDTPVTLALHHGPATPDSAASGGTGVALATEHPPVQLLPPERLLPFMTPFVGGKGPLCGGPAAFAAANTRWAWLAALHCNFNIACRRAVIDPYSMRCLAVMGCTASAYMTSHDDLAMNRLNRLASTSLKAPSIRRNGALVSHFSILAYFRHGCDRFALWLQAEQQL